MSSIDNRLNLVILIAEINQLDLHHKNQFEQWIVKYFKHKQTIYETVDAQSG